MKYYWAIWEADPSTARYRFEWEAWPASVWYEE